MNGDTPACDDPGMPIRPRDINLDAPPPRRRGWRVILPAALLACTTLDQMQHSFERQAANGELPEGCIGFEVVPEYGVPEPEHVYTCVRFRA